MAAILVFALVFILFVGTPLYVFARVVSTWTKRDSLRRLEQLSEDVK